MPKIVFYFFYNNKDGILKPKRGQKRSKIRFLLNHPPPPY